MSTGNLWNASYMLDGLVGAIQPSDVWQKAQVINTELNMIASHMQVSFDGIEAPQRKDDSTPRDAAKQALKNLYDAARLQNDLGLEQAMIQGITPVRIRPSDASDLSNMLLAELVRMKVPLGLVTPEFQPYIFTACHTYLM